MKALKLLAIVKYLFFPFLMANAAPHVNIGDIIGTQPMTGLTETVTTVWVGTNNGLWIVNKENNKVAHLTTENSVLPSNHVTGITETTDGNVYVATEKGIFRYDGFAYLVIDAENSKLPANGITSIASDEDDNLWVGTKNGLVLVNNYKCRYFTTGNSVLTTNEIEKVSSDNKGNIYVQLTNHDVVKVGHQHLALISGQTDGNNTVASSK